MKTRASPFAAARPKYIAPPVGIDIGTTESRIAIWEDGQPRVLASFPSVMCFSTRGLLVGDAAKARASTMPKQTFFDFKRFLECVHTKETLDRATYHLPFRRYLWLCPSGRVRVLAYSAAENGVSILTPTQLYTELLGALKRAAEAKLAEEGPPSLSFGRGAAIEVRSAVLTVPTCFDDAQRCAVVEAARAAGLHVQRLTSDTMAVAVEACRANVVPTTLLPPEAAALAAFASVSSVSSSWSGASNGGASGGSASRDQPWVRTLVYSLGGGFAQASVIDVRCGVYRMVCTEGVPYGGNDLDAAVLKTCLKMAGTSADFRKAGHKFNEHDPRAQGLLLAAAQHAKHDLCARPGAFDSPRRGQQGPAPATIAVGNLQCGLGFTYELHADSLKAHIKPSQDAPGASYRASDHISAAPLLDRFLLPVKACIGQLQSDSHIHVVLLAGQAATMLPLLSASIETYAKQRGVSLGEVKPFGGHASAAFGAAAQAAFLQSRSPSADCGYARAGAGGLDGGAGAGALSGHGIEDIHELGVGLRALGDVARPRDGPRGGAGEAKAQQQQATRAAQLPEDVRRTARRLLADGDLALDRARESAEQEAARGWEALRAEERRMQEEVAGAELRRAFLRLEMYVCTLQERVGELRALADAAPGAIPSDDLDVLEGACANAPFRRMESYRGAMQLLWRGEAVAEEQLPSLKEVEDLYEDARAAWRGHGAELLRRLEVGVDAAVLGGAGSSAVRGMQELLHEVRGALMLSPMQSDNA